MTMASLRMGECTAVSRLLMLGSDLPPEGGSSLFCLDRCHRGGAAHLDAVNPAAFGFHDFDDQAVELEGLADRRHPAHPRQHVAADGLEALRLDFDVEPIPHLGEVRLAAE